VNRWTWQRGPEPQRINCLHVMRVMQSYLDGETDEVTARRVAAHLESCRRCGLDAAVYREIKNALARREAPDPSSIDRLRAFGQSLLEAPGTDERSDQAGDPPAS
jgi:anti-sigma factor RsiW